MKTSFWIFIEAHGHGWLDFCNLFVWWLNWWGNGCPCKWNDWRRTESCRNDFMKHRLVAEYRCHCFGYVKMFVYCIIIIYYNALEHITKNYEDCSQVSIVGFADVIRVWTLDGRVKGVYVDENSIPRTWCLPAMYHRSISVWSVINFYC